ncbi:hypothetical protein [Spirochaeta lutea]|uniref:Outer membrane protein beta-barrel domain-containing protein n=1 Tax=Spirochaeta lutea TaxID=1480694 RepID=A0A098QZN9_9SPIO|nr:hypothetical protein [Spirochaeta lutea]KGE71957.1 hypothetical protein DC28_09185 [Spirochaeta lutea]
MKRGKKTGLKAVTALILLSLLLPAGFSQHESPDVEQSPAPQEPQSRGNDTPGVALGFHRGVFWQGQSVPGTVQGAETSPILGAFGISLRLPFSTVLALNPALDFFTDEYLYSESVGRAVPTQIESGGNLGPIAQVFGLGITLPLEITLRLGPSVDLFFGPGISGILRIPLWGIDGTTQDEIGIIWTDLHTRGRWFFPEVRLGSRVAIGSAVSFIGMIKTEFPIWHAWDEAAMPFYDTLFIWVNLGLEVRL